MQTSLPMTALMQANFMGKQRGQGIYFQYIDKKFSEFKYLVGDDSRIDLLIFEVQVRFDVQCTTSGRGNDVIEVFKRIVEKVVALICKMLKTSIGHRLTATCLSGGIRDL